MFFTNQGSRKGVELAAEPRCALLFPWHPLKRQVPVEGTATVLPDEDVTAYFASRPRGSRLGAHASHQSRVVASRDELATAYAAAEAAFPDDVQVPDEWGGFRSAPRSWSSGRGDPGGCTTGSSTAAPVRTSRPGAPSAWPPQRPDHVAARRARTRRRRRRPATSPRRPPGTAGWCSSPARLAWEDHFVSAVVAAAGATALVALGGCDGSATPAPLGPLGEMLPALPDGVWPGGSDATRSSPGHRRAPHPARPFLLVVEDAHWADDATLDLIRHLARRVHGRGRWCWSPTARRTPPRPPAALAARRRGHRRRHPAYGARAAVAGRRTGLVGSAGRATPPELYR